MNELKDRISNRLNNYLEENPKDAIPDDSPVP